MKFFNEKTLTKAVIGVGGIAALLAIGGYIGSKNPQTSAVSKTNSSYHREHKEINSSTSSSNYVSTTVTKSQYCKDSQKYLVQTVKEALSSQAPGNKIIKIGDTKPAPANPDTGTMDGKVVASCQTNIFASLGGKYPVD